jgi:hypothetical protein
MALPGQFISDIQQMQNFRKAPIRILPNSTASEVRSNGLIKFMLPVGCVLDMRTMAVHFHAKTQLANGNPATSATPANARVVGFPKYMQSLIQTFEVWVNNKNVTQINEFGRVYSLLQDFKRNRDRKLGNNADPSMYTFVNEDGSLSSTSQKVPDVGTTAFNVSANSSAGDYVIDEFLGFTNGSPSILDTNILGQIEIVLKLHNGNNVLWGAKGDGSALDAGDNLDFILSNIIMFIDKIDFRDEKYYSAVKSIVESSQGLKIAFKNYMYYQGDATTNNKNNTIKITESTQCLDKIIYTYYDNTDAAVEGKKALQLTTDGPVSANIANHNANLLNSSLYYRRNGVGLGTVQFEVNSQNVTDPLTITQQWQETLKAFEMNEYDSLHHINPSIKDLNYYKKDFYVCALSTSHINHKGNSTLMSGIDTQATSLNLVVKSLQEAGVATNDAQAGVPVVITEMTSMLLVSGQRQVMFIR